MNWGTKITIVYCSFVVMILTLVVMASRHRVELVADDYYELELKFQEKIDKVKRSNELVNPLSVDYSGGKLQIGFPREMNHSEITGTVSIYSPAKKSNDRTFDISGLKSQQQIIELKNFPNGIYTIQIDWSVDGVNYYNEKIITI